MQHDRTQPSIDRDDPFAPGVYLTDGSSLFNIVGALPHEPSLRLVEDCSTLEILMVRVDGLTAPGVRRVQAMALEEPDAQDRGLSLAQEDTAVAPSALHAQR